MKRPLTKNRNLSRSVSPQPSLLKLIGLPWRKYMMVTEGCRCRFAGKASAKSTCCCAKSSMRLWHSVGCLRTVTVLDCCCTYEQASKKAAAASRGQAFHRSGHRSGKLQTLKSPKWHRSGTLQTLKSRISLKQSLSGQSKWCAHSPLSQSSRAA